jgi:DNA-binding FadR family transcriptional regulator
LTRAEEMALRESIKARGKAWEEARVSAHHRLSRTPRSWVSDRFEDNPEWEPLHRSFARRAVKNEHLQLTEAAIEGRADEAAALLRQHFERTAEVIRSDPRLFV